MKNLELVAAEQEWFEFQKRGNNADETGPSGSSDSGMNWDKIFNDDEQFKVV